MNRYLHAGPGPGLVRRGILAVLIGLALAGATPVAVRAVTVTWGLPAATSAFGTAIEFTQPVTLSSNPTRVEILLDFPGAPGPFVGEVAASTAMSGTALSYHLDVTSNQLAPNTRIAARWRVTLPDGTVELGPSVTATYVDTRFDWRTRSGPIVRIHWYQGDEAFAARALHIGEQAVDRASRLLGVTETEPIDFFVYADQKPFYDALGPATRENVGGQARSDIRTLFALITPDEIGADWVGIVIPHELTHLVFNTAVKNPYHFPPRWFDEGVAVYLAEGYAPSYRADLGSGISDGRIMPLSSLTGQFPTAERQFYLAYAESVSAVSYIIDTYGEGGLVRLIRAYAGGVSDDEAFRTGLGIGVDDLERGWLASIGVSAPARVGPQPAPAGPVPAAWASAPPAAATSAPLMSPSAAASVPSAAPSPNAVARPIDERDLVLAAFFLLVFGFLVAVTLGAVFALMRRPGPPPPPGGWGSQWGGSADPGGVG